MRIEQLKDETAAQVNNVLRNLRNEGREILGVDFYPEQFNGGSTYHIIKYS